jgi:SHS2 domain-containing protein
VRFEVENMMYSKFEIQNICKRNDGKFTLKAKIYGEPFNPEKHKQKVGIKAVTYHRMEIKEENDKVTVKFILDI